MLRTIYNKNDSDHGLGQYFCINYIGTDWHGLSYIEDDKKAADLIESWLAEHEYMYMLPPTVNTKTFHFNAPFNIETKYGDV